MVRSFDGTPVDAQWLDDVCAEALRAPTAGNAAGVRMHTVSANDVASLFKAATDEEWRASARRAPGLARAGGAVLVTCRVSDYLERYAEPDKSSSGLSERDAWLVPYWYTDAAMATMTLLLLLEESDWHATLWGNFRHDARVLAWAGVSGEELFATVLIGHGDGGDVASASLARDVVARRQRVRRVDP